jgi:hypothetical protein
MVRKVVIRVTWTIGHKLRIDWMLLTLNKDCYFENYILKILPLI